MAYLMLSAMWSTRPEVLHALREKVATGTPGVSPSDVRLVFAPVEHVRCNLKLGDGRGDFVTIASSDTSGMPPYDAVFSVAITEDSLARSKAALLGELGNLAIEYTAQLAVPAHGESTLDVAAAELFPEGASKDPTTIRRALEEAIARKAARITVDCIEPVTAEFVTALYKKVLDRSVEIISRSTRIPEKLHIEVRLDKQVRESIHAFADVGELVSSQFTSAATGGPDATN